MHFPDIIFQQVNSPVRILKIIGNFFPRTRVEGTRMASIKSGSESDLKFMSNFEATITKTDGKNENKKFRKFGIKLTQTSRETCMKTIQTV